MACIVRRRNRWVIDFYDHIGQRQRISMPGGCTKTKARERLREIEEQVSRGAYLPWKEIPTFGEVAGKWIAYKKMRIRESTWKNYHGYVRNHYEELNSMRIDRILPATIEKFISLRMEGGMGKHILKEILVVLGQIMKYAVRHKYIMHNPVADIERSRSEGTEAKIIRVLSPSEVQTFLAQEKNQKYRTLFLVAIMTGARQGEILGLKWSDLDMETHQVHIQRSVRDGKFVPPKTPTSTRKVDLGPDLMNELRKWKLACPKVKKQGKESLDLIFPNEEGNLLERHNLRQRHFLPSLKAAGLPRIRFHDLRHTNASVRLEAGQNIKYIATQLGHANPTITLNTYAHLIKDRDSEAAARLEEAIFSTTGHKMVTNDDSRNEKGGTIHTVTP